MLSRKCKSAAIAAASVALFLGAAGTSLASAAPRRRPLARPPARRRRPSPKPGSSRSGPRWSTSRPSEPMADGGYGSDYIVTGGAHDPLQVRAFFVGHGKQAVAFVSVDSQGWFAAYQSPNVGDGADNARTDAAAALAARGYEVNAANIVLSATHTTPHRRSWVSGAHRPGIPAPSQGSGRPCRPQGCVPHARSRTMVGHGHDQGPRLAAAGDRSDGRLLGRPAAPDPVGAPARHRCDDRHLRRRAGARRRIRRDRGRKRPVERRLPRVGSGIVSASCSAVPLSWRSPRSAGRRPSARTSLQRGRKAGHVSSRTRF